MADTAQQVLLDKGLDTVTPALLTEPGSLIDCLNYEMTTDVGYRRIDGYEPFDGWIRGDIADYYRVDLTINDAAVVASLTVGTPISLTPTQNVVGIVLAYSGNTSSGTLTYAPVDGERPIIASGTTLSINTTSTTRMTAASTAVKGSVADSLTTFLTNIRSYRSTLRALVSTTTAPICGVHWFREFPLAAIDTPVITTTTGSFNPAVGTLIAYSGKVYRVLEVAVVSGASTLYVEEQTYYNYASFARIDIVSEPYFNGIGMVNALISTPAGLGTVTLSTTAASNQASLWAYYTPKTKTTSGKIQMARSVILGFSGGIAAAEAEWVPDALVRFGPNTADYLRGRIMSVNVTSGSFAGNNAAGYLEVVMSMNVVTTSPIASSALVHGGMIDATWDIYDSGLVKRADVTAAYWSTIAGSKKLRTEDTRYVWENYNFLSQQKTLQAFGATGASRAFWAYATGSALIKPVYTSSPPLSLDDNFKFIWGSILTSPTSTVDVPKYLAKQGPRLALAYSEGSVVRSVVGEPQNFSGFQGADELGTGDFVTGLLEGAGDSLIVLGNKSVTRITGTTDADTQQQVISGCSGAINYTGTLCAGMPVFASPNGITTLEQVQQYGDFIGERVSSKVNNVLVPKLVVDWSDTRPGGAAMAMPVRTKNQYRLWLNTGEVYSVTFTSQGPRVMKSNYNTKSGGSYSLNVPFAWCSEMSEGLKERLLVVWDTDLAAKNVNANGTTMLVPSGTTIYELDRGWGFAGTTFDFYFDLAHIFGGQGAMFSQIDKIRMYGMSHGYNVLDAKTASVETDFEQAYHTNTQDISMPRSASSYYFDMHNVMGIVDQANWGLGTKIRINGTTAAGSSTTEPPHICQVMILYSNKEGALDN